MKYSVFELTEKGYAIKKQRIENEIESPSTIEHVPEKGQSIARSLASQRLKL